MQELQLESVVAPRLGAMGYFRRHVVEVLMPFVALADALIVAAAFQFCYTARFQWGWFAPAPPPPWGPYLHASALVAVVWTAGLAFAGLYDAKRPASRFDDAVLTFAGLAVGGVCGAGLAALYRSFSYSRLIYAYALVAALVALWAWHLGLRAAQMWARQRGWGVFNTLVVGHNPLAARVTERLLARPQSGRVVRGVIAMPGEVVGPDPGVPILGRGTDLARLVEAQAIDEVVVAWPGASAAELGALVREAMALGSVAVQIAPAVIESLTIHLEVASLDGLPMLAVREVALRKWRNRAIKRAMDVVLASVGLLVAAPLLAAIGLGVRLGSPGPALYAQERLGRDGHLFTIYKFRSMPVGAEPDGPVWTRQGDVRATPLGAILRRYSLDELPQLWNVLVGDMSLVGPRPERPFFVERFSEHVPRYMDRHLVRCGLTGWAQVNGLRGDVDIDERTRYDIQYVENWSVLLDLRILFMTLMAIFRRPAY